MSSNKGMLVVISGFSGAGKGTLMKELTQKYTEDYALSVSATTRSPRPGEVEGVSYFFLGREQFEEKIAQGQFIEYAQYVGNYYGTPREYVDARRKEGKNVILEIEIQGALKVREKFPDTVLIFVTAPSAAELKNRLTQRGTESEEVIGRRLARAYEESLGMENYDYLVINDNLEEATERLHAVIQRERDGQRDQNAPHAVSSHIDFINNMRGELLSFSKGE